VERRVHIAYLRRIGVKSCIVNKNIYTFNISILGSPSKFDLSNETFVQKVPGERILILRTMY
jgi:hypothetical protein